MSINVVAIASKRKAKAVEPTEIELKRLIDNKFQHILKGLIPAGEKPEEILKDAAKEAFGWDNFAVTNDYITSCPEELIENFAQVLKLEESQADGIIKGIDRASCKPREQSKKDGIEKCAKRLARALKRDEPAADRPIPRRDDIQLESTDQPGRVAWRELYNNDDHVCISDNVYRFTGTYYELVDPGKRRHEIAKILNRCIGTDKEGQLVRSYATSRHTSDAYNYTAALMRSVKPDEVNRDGINCLNGVLKLHWDKRALVKRLVPHDPRMIFTSPPRVEYDEEADATNLNALLQAVDPKFRSIVLRTLAASLDLKKCKEEQHRPVRIASFIGDGSNGKDALKTAMTMILGGRGLTSVPLTAFTQYDQGRQFGITGLAGSLLNWPSENSFTSTLDSLECIKSVVTGEPLQYEEKNKQGSEFTPNCVLIFNGNAETIKLIASSEAVRSRYAIVPFEKTFKNKPDPLDPNELQADPRFKNPDWVADNVCSAMLNVLLTELEAVVNEGIDYTPIEDVMNEHTRASFHLAQFVDDFGLVPSKGDRVAVSEVWLKLQDWYKNEDLLEVEDRNGRDHLVWGADPRPGDKLIRSKQQLSSSIVKFVDGASNKGAGSKSGGIRYITGVKWDNPVEQVVAQKTDAESIAEQMTKAESWNDYVSAVQNVGEGTKAKAWALVPQHQQNLIVGWQPKEAIAQQTEIEPEWEEIKPEAYTSPVLAVGDVVRYIGENYTSLLDQRLVVTMIKGNLVTCQKPDERLTTWLDKADLRPIA
ncbi:MAG: DUF5906 domain-containing protein [Phormidesmis sp.]